MPKALEDVWEILEREPDAMVYVGGTDLLVGMRAGRVNPPCLVCLERVTALQVVHDDGEQVFIGAGITHSRLLENEIVLKEFAVLVEGMKVLGSPPIRHMGTIGGNIVMASPAGDTLPALYVLDAEVEIRSSSRMRRVRIRDFIQGPGTVGLERSEIVIGVWLKKTEEFTICHYEKVGRRKAQACAVASMAALLKISDTKRIESARLAWGSVGPTVVTSSEVERALIGEPLSLDTLKRAVPLVEEVVSPIDDIRAGADYRRVVAGALLLRLVKYSIA